MKKILMKTIFKNVLLLLLVTFFLSACNTGTDKQDSQFETDETDDGFIYNLYGSNINICADIGSESKTFLSFDKSTGLADIIVQRFSDTEKAFNCTIKKSKILSITEIQTQAASGSGDVDFFTEFIYYGDKAYNTDDLFIPISEYGDYLDLTDSFRWGNPNNMEMFAKNGKIYGVYPASWPDTGIMSTDYLLVYNQEMVVNELRLPDPREYYETKQWTRDKFVESVTDYTHQDGEGKLIKGFSVYDRHLLDISLRSFNVNMVKHEGENWVTGYNTPEGIIALDWCAQFMKGGKLEDFTVSKGVADSVKAWVNGDVTMCMLHSNYTFSNAGTDSSSEVIYCGTPYGIMPFPSGDGTLIAQYERCINASLIPSFTEDPVASVMLINALYAPLPGYESDEALFDYYSSNVFLDSRDARLILDMTKNSHYLFHHEGGNTLNTNIASRLGKNTPAEILEMYQNDLDILATDYIIPSYESLEELFGKTLY